MAVELLGQPPTAGRTYRSIRRIRLSDRDVDGRLRLDAVARYLQDVAMDDVDETGWGAPDHLWVLRHIRVDVRVPLTDDDWVELETWCSGTAAVAAGRRLSVVGDQGGRVELDSVWVHLAPDARPTRIGDFGAYAVAAGGRVVSPRVDVPHPPADGTREVWPLRSTDIDLLGHVNNAVYWQAVEQCLVGAGLDPSEPTRALLGYRHAIDLDEEIELVEFSDDGRFAVAFMANEVVKAVACVEPLVQAVCNTGIR